MQLIKIMLIITKQKVKILSQMLAIINLHPHMSIIFIILGMYSDQMEYQLQV